MTKLWKECGLCLELFVCINSTEHRLRRYCSFDCYFGMLRGELPPNASIQALRAAIDRTMARYLRAKDERHRWKYLYSATTLANRLAKKTGWDEVSV